MFRLAHISDPHLPIEAPPRLQQMANKRIFGWLSWRHRRSLVHRQEILDALARDLDAASIDHLVITGDLGNISLPSEFEAAGRWLEGLGDPATVTVIPGNHDAYVDVPWNQSLIHWTPFMSGDDQPQADKDGPVSAFPFVRRRDPVALVGLSTAVPTPPGSAAGRLGQRQRDALRNILRQLDSEGLYRVVLIHHPVVSTGTSPLARLMDAAALAHIIADVGADLILHGHNHRFQVHALAGPRGPVPVIGAPSASAAGRAGKHAGGYCLYEIDPKATENPLGITHRVCNASGSCFTSSPRIPWPRGAPVLPATG